MNISQQELSKPQLMRAATYASVSVAVILIVVKFYAWLATDSVSLLSTLVDSVLDAGASLVNLIAIHFALQPADSEHRFGHGKAEPLAGLMQSGFIFASALFLIIETGNRFLNPSAVENSEMGIIVMVISIGLTVALVLFQKYVVRKTKSVAVSADSLHYTTDILVNVGVIVALVVAAYTDWLWFDPLVAGVIAIYILYSVREIAVEAMDLLMDREFEEEERANIMKIVLEHPGVLGGHDLRTRSSGPQSFIQLHLVLDGNLTLRDSHAIADEVEFKLGEAYPDAEILIHQDPHDVVENPPNFAKYVKVKKRTNRRSK
ncbi:cation diffusion facilitator family transporter [Terasakiella sp. A23]|uniref:cation diffusion facilitator family transporter n=1 Tax=Terasakiella sp. FCG-A23 TaxID=3080561 RepID=UPI002952B43D|nr:cation diffusion facilitator family transporter [Terasakiella sp. A23]MDV7340111.1 cation diffusion facilitator family transporter [Terasakiella sp. A23]